MPHATPAVQLNVRVSPETYAKVVELVEGGGYQTKADVITAAIAALLHMREQSAKQPEMAVEAGISPSTEQERGQLPYGYEWRDGRPAKDEERYPGLVALVELKERGLSLQAIADELNARGVPTKKGGPWMKQTVAKTYERYREAVEAGRVTA